MNFEFESAASWGYHRCREWNAAVLQCVHDRGNCVLGSCHVMYPSITIEYMLQIHILLKPYLGGAGREKGKCCWGGKNLNSS